MRKHLASFAAGALALSLLGPATGSAAPASRRGFEAAETQDCLEGVPEQASITGVTDDGHNVDLDVRVLLDGVSQKRGEEVMARAAKPYAALNITLRATFQQVDIPAQRLESEFVGDPERPTSDTEYFFANEKALFGGARPPDADVVYLLTTDRLPGTTAGVADCIGGVRYADRAFAVGEEDVDTEPGTLALCCTWATAKVAAHEIAHLLGAHHHYANCAEGAPAAIEEPQLMTCTLMFNDVGATNLRFSTLEGAVVRGHALEFADRAPAVPAPTSTPTPSSTPSGEPSPQPSSSTPPPPKSVAYGRSVTLKVGRRSAAGVVGGDASVCSAGASVALERRSHGEWSEMARTVSASDGTFRFKLPAGRATYRASVAETHGDDAGGTYTCSSATSRPARRSSR